MQTYYCAVEYEAPSMVMADSSFIINTPTLYISATESYERLHHVFTHGST